MKKIPNNDQVIKFLMQYGIALLIGIAVLWFGVSLFERVVYSIKTPNTCSVDELVVGTVVSFHKDSYVITKLNYWKSLGKANIDLQRYEK